MIAFIGDSGRKIVASSSSELRNDVSFAKVVQSCLPKKVADVRVLHEAHVVDDGKGKQQAIELSKEMHAYLEGF